MDSEEPAGTAEKTAKRPRLKLPRGVEGWLDRMQRPVHYYRPTRDAKRIRLPGLPYSAEFNAALEAAKGGTPTPIRATEIARRIMRGSLREGMVKYLASPAFARLGDATGYRRRLKLENFCQVECPDGSLRGDRAIDDLDRHKLKIALDEIPSRHTAVDTLKAMRHMFEYLESVDPDITNPTLGCKTVGPDMTDGFHTWDEASIIAFAKKHPINSVARLAMAIMLYTGLRLSDALKVGPQHFANGRIKFKPHKTSKSSKFVLDMPVDPRLAKVMKAHGKSPHLTLLINPNTGQPYNPVTFSHHMRAWCDAAGLPDCASHGLRKAICVRLANMGCNVMEIASITGHKNLRVLQKYCDEYDRAKASDRAMEKLLAADKAMAA